MISPPNSDETHPYGLSLTILPLHHQTILFACLSYTTTFCIVVISAQMAQSICLSYLAIYAPVFFTSFTTYQLPVT